MQKPTYWATIGFTPDEDEIIKLHVQAQFSNILNWVAGNNPDLEVAIINAAFLDNPKIIKYLEKISPTNIKVAIACRSVKEASAARELNLNIINLVKLNNEYLKTFFTKFLNENPDESATKKYIAPEPVKQLHEPFSQEEILELIDKLQMLPHNMLLTFENKKIIINAHGKVAWINYPRDDVFGLERVDYEEADNALVIGDEFTQVKLEQWLFSAIWHTRMTFTAADKNTNYKLRRWPQPLGRHSRSTVLRLTAELQKQPASARVLQQESGLPMEIVQRFISTMLYVNLVEIVPVKINNNDDNQSPISVREEKIVDEVKLSLLQRIRAKFGL